MVQVKVIYSCVPPRCTILIVSKEAESSRATTSGSTTNISATIYITSILTNRVVCLEHAFEQTPRPLKATKRYFIKRPR
jgi:hypothetical protein